MTAGESTIQSPTPILLTSSASAPDLATTSYQTQAIGATTTTAAPTGGGFSFAGVVVPIMAPVLVVAAVIFACMLLGSNLFQKYKRRNHVVAINSEGLPVQVDEEQGVNPEVNPYATTNAQAHVYENPVSSQPNRGEANLKLKKNKLRHNKPEGDTTDPGAHHYEEPERDSGFMYSELLAGHGIYKGGQQPLNNSGRINPVYETDVDDIFHRGYEEPDGPSQNHYNALKVHQIYRPG